MREPLRVLLAGEGANELGSFHAETPYRESGDEFGVIEALVRSFSKIPFVVRDGITWKRIRKYRSGAHASAERRTVLGLILIAKERGFDAVVFVRDSDGDAQRAVEIDAAIAVSHEVIVGAPRVAGAAAVQSLEAWLLALAGESRTESMSAAKLEATLVERGTRYKCTSDYVAIIEARRGAEPPHDALSLRAFQERVRAALLDDE